jgi:hypothetical protein
MRFWGDRHWFLFHSQQNTGELTLRRSPQNTRSATSKLVLRVNKHRPQIDESPVLFEPFVQCPLGILQTFPQVLFTPQPAMH